MSLLQQFSRFADFSSDLIKKASRQFAALAAILLFALKIVRLFIFSYWAIYRIYIGRDSKLANIS